MKRSGVIKNELICSKIKTSKQFWDFEAWKNSYPTEEQIKKYKEAMGKICMYCKKTIRIEDFMDGKASDRWQPDTAYAPERTDYYHVACDNEAATDTLGKLK